MLPGYKEERKADDVMAAVSVEHVNLILMAATKVLKDTCQIEAAIGKPTVRDTPVTNDFVIIIVGITGQMSGQIMIDLPQVTACNIASKMCMMTITEMNEISISALSELGNMIMGNVATLFSSKGIAMDITTPKVSRDDSVFANGTKNLCVPITFDGNQMFGIHIIL